MWNDTQPTILLLAETINKSPMFKEIEAQDPERAVLLSRELDAEVNTGNYRYVSRGIKQSSSETIRRLGNQKEGKEL